MSTDPDRRPAETRLEAALDPEPAGVPEFAGSADSGVVDSVGEHHPMAGDAADLLQAELGKLHGLYGDVVALVDAGRLEEFGERWFGVVRETLEFEAALGRVVVPEVPDAAAELGDAAPPALVERLRAYDEMNSDRSPDVLRGAAAETVQALRDQERVLLPAVQRLAVDVRDRLGEDLRQVMG